MHWVLFLIHPLHLKNNPMCPVKKIVLLNFTPPRRGTSRAESPTSGDNPLKQLTVAV